MSPADHNKTLVLIYSLLSGLITLPLLTLPLIMLASPSIVAKNLKSPEQFVTAIIVFCVVLFLALIFPATAYSLYKRKVGGRTLALISAVLLLPLCWPIGVYTWWFMHSEGAKQMYRLK
ncbi:MAG: hypothetical protein QOF62_320 [Pyrinomonadaceae bacterium]|nr:hypothetical protein [Pyrinomonadaceae bacterium]